MLAIESNYNLHTFDNELFNDALTQFPGTLLEF